MLVASFSMVAYAAGRGDRVGFWFTIEEKGVGHTSDPAEKELVVSNAYVSIDKNSSSSGGKATTAFIVVKSTGHQLSNGEIVVTGTGTKDIPYNNTGENYLGATCIRANAAGLIHVLATTVQGTFYPDGR